MGTQHVTMHCLPPGAGVDRAFQFYSNRHFFFLIRYVGRAPEMYFSSNAAEFAFFFSVSIVTTERVNKVLRYKPNKYLVSLETTPGRLFSRLVILVTQSMTIALWEKRPGVFF